MITVTSYPIAVVMCIVTMICWGSWGNTQKLASKSWKFQLFYWDYTIGILLFSLLMAFTMGSFGDGGRSFLADLSQADSQWLMSALIGGIIFNLSNILLVIAIDIAGLAVAFPVGIGLALVLGVITTYAAKPDGNPVMLGLGVALICVAIVVDALAFKRLGGKGATVKGIAVSALAGFLMGFFYSFVAEAMGNIDMSTGKAVLEYGNGRFCGGHSGFEFCFQYACDEVPRGRRQERFVRVVFHRRQREAPLCGHSRRFDLVFGHKP